MPNLKWLCFGAGAIGTYVGGSLSLAGEDVVFLEQPAALGEVRARGLRLDLRADQRRRASEALVLAPSALVFCESLEEALHHGPFDAAIYALKSFDTEAAVDSMRPLAGSMPPVVCFSNGVENEAELARVLGDGKVIAATVTTAIGRRGPGDVVLERLRGVGILSTHAISSRLLGSANAAQLSARPYEDAAAMKWSKMLTNLIANPTSAILDMTAAEVLGDPGIYRMEIEVLRECLAVMRARGISIVDLPGTPVRALAIAAQLPAWASKPFLARAGGAGRGGKMPSFHIDLHSGRGRSEVEFLHGAIVRAGKELGVPTPVSSFLAATLIALTEGRIAPQEFGRKPEKLIRALHDRASTL
ncbi:MAG: 2-dehydropantoate 2-reductase [Chloroflexota bacterium]